MARCCLDQPAGVGLSSSRQLIPPLLVALTVSDPASADHSVSYAHNTINISLRCECNACLVILNTKHGVPKDRMADLLTTSDLQHRAGFPSNATHATYARKYVTNAMNARKVRNKRSWRNGCSNYPQPRPLLCLHLQFNATQQNEFYSSATNKVNEQK